MLTLDSLQTSIKVKTIVCVGPKQLYDMFASVTSTTASVTLSAGLFIIWHLSKYRLFFHHHLTNKQTKPKQLWKTADSITFKAHERRRQFKLMLVTSSGGSACCFLFYQQVLRRGDLTEVAQSLKRDWILLIFLWGKNSKVQEGGRDREVF